MIYYCCPTLNQHRNLLKWCDAAMSGTLKPDKLLIIDNSGRYLCEDIDFGDYPVHIEYPDENLGVGPSWNVFLSHVYDESKTTQLGVDDYCIIANDDVLVHSHTLESLVNAAKQDKKNVFFHGSGHSGNSFSLFLLTARGYIDAGSFDEMLWPAYFEDNDYHTRLKLAGHDIVGIESATFDHIGSATVNMFTDQQKMVQHERYRRNETYYKLKWGGLPHQETYTTPYDGKKDRVIKVIKEKYGY